MECDIASCGSFQGQGDQHMPCDDRGGPGLGQGRGIHHGDHDASHDLRCRRSSGCGVQGQSSHTHIRGQGCPPQKVPVGRVRYDRHGPCAPYRRGEVEAVPGGSVRDTRSRDHHAHRHGERAQRRPPYFRGRPHGRLRARVAVPSRKGQDSAGI